MVGRGLGAVVSVATFVSACGQVESDPSAETPDARAPSAATDDADARAPSAEADVLDPREASAEADADYEPATTDPNGPSVVVTAVFGELDRPITSADVEELRMQACAGWRVAADSWSAGMFLVLDASSSMKEPAPGGGGQSKWEVVQDAVSEAVASLGDSIAVGLLAYPNQQLQDSSGDYTACVNTGALVPLGRLGKGDHRQVLVDALHAVEVYPCRPTHDAYVIGLEALAQSPASALDYLLLITDGQPTLSLYCEPGDCTASLPGAQRAVVDEIGRAFNEQRVHTFVFGLPGTAMDAATGADARWWLSQAAVAGGSSSGNCSHDAPPYCHYDLADADQLARALDQALQRALGQVEDCHYPLPIPPEGALIDLDAIHFVVWLDSGYPIEILRNENPGCAPDGQGWYFDEATMMLGICPETCALLRSDPLAELELIVGCTY